ncbi:DUF7224 domain-containing protein [Streptomyces sp. RGM 3693]|uniref:DUF7224 domain-containing protein n=1 Tax=Streptomyces sp. RGM 3693 TaxID=3413284 RepID=UPI003D29871A
MYVKTVLRTSTAPRAAIVLIPWLLAYSGNIRRWITDGYWESVTAQSSFLLGFIAPACAACAAWEGARVKRSGMLESAPSRTPLNIAISVLWPVAFLGALSVMLGVVLSAPQASGLPAWSSFVLLTVEIAVVVAHTAAGYTAGLILPRLLAAPAALIASFLWMAFPAAMGNPPWLRQLNGHNFNECCALDQVPDGRGLGAAAIVAVGVTIACAAWINMSGVRRLLGPAVLGLALTTGCVMVAPMGYRSAQPRDLAELDCRTGPSGVCLWPEQQGAALSIEKWGSAARRNLEAAGVHPAQKVKVMSAAPRQGEVASVVAFSAVPQDIPPCARAGQWPGSQATGPVMAWLVLTAGTPPQDVEGAYAEAEVRLAQQVRHLPLVGQQRWFHRNAATLTRCDKQPDLAPEHFAAGAAR